MKRFIVFLVSVMAFVSFTQAQTFNGGYLNPSPYYTAYSFEMALRAISGVHSCINADSIAIRPGRKWGSNYILKCIYNNSASTQIYTIVDSTKETGLDTFTMNLAAYTTSFPLPYSVLITGCVIDSTLYIRQYFNK
jgi:hypothetical protein